MAKNFTFAVLIRIIIFSIVAGIFLIALIIFFDKSVKITELEKENLQIISQILKSEIEKKDILNNKLELRKLIYRYRQTGSDFQIIVLKNNFKVIYADNPNIEGKIFKSSLIAEASFTGRTKTISQNGITNICVPIKIKGLTKGFFILKYTKPRGKKNLERLVDSMLLLLTVFAFILLILAAYITYKKFKRLKSISNTAKEIAYGNLNKKIKLKDAEDFEQLIEAFNKIVEDLKNRIKESEIANRKLEQINKERELLLKKVKQFNIELQDKVKKSTEDLKRTNKILDEKVKELAHLKIFNENIFSSIKSGIISLDLNHNITFLNKEAESILEISLNNAKNKNIKEVLSNKPEFVELLISDSTSNLRQEITITNNKGNKVVLGVSLSQLVSSNKKKYGTVAVFRDITETNKLLEHIRRTKNLVALGQLGAGVAHEFRNPLGAIRGFAEMILNITQNQSVKKYSSKIIDEVIHLNKIVNDVLDFAKPAKKPNEKVELYKCVSDAFLSSEFLFNSKNVNAKLENNVEKNIRIKSDYSLLKRVIVNLISNACEAVKEKGSVLVKTGVEANDVVCISVEDNGCGIPESELEYIFNPFYTTKTEGAGLGLAITYKIVESHGGTIEVESKKGEGTKFKVRFKIAK